MPKTDDAGHLCQWDLQIFSNHLLHLKGEIAVNTLRQMEHLNEGTLFLPVGAGQLSNSLQELGVALALALSATSAGRSCILIQNQHLQ